MIERRGVVILLKELNERWLEWIKNADLNLLALHTFDQNEVIQFIQSKRGKNLLSKAEDLKIDIEYELHVLSWLLPRDYFKSNPKYFRVNYQGNRTSDYNCCVSNHDALNIIRNNARKLAKIIQPSTDRYYFWQDDGKDIFCHCDECKSLSDSDQELILMNTILQGIKQSFPDAKLSFLAYLSTLTPPQFIRPEKDIFLEFAPIKRTYRHPINDNTSRRNVKQVQKLKSLISYFGIKNAQVLEYWLDCSLSSKWFENVREKLPFQEQVVETDVKFYKSLGFKSITSFAVFLDDLYMEKHGIPPIKKYGDILKR